MVIKACKASPANVKGGENIFLGVIHYLTEFFPVVYAFECKKFYWGSGNNHSIKLFVVDFAGWNVKLVQVIFVGIFAFVAFDSNQGNFNLERGVS